MFFACDTACRPDGHHAGFQNICTATLVLLSATLLAFAENASDCQGEPCTFAPSMRSWGQTLQTSSTRQSATSASKAASTHARTSDPWNGSSTDWSASRCKLCKNRLLRWVAAEKLTRQTGIAKTARQLCYVATLMVLLLLQPAHLSAAAGCVQLVTDFASAHCSGVVASVGASKADSYAGVGELVLRSVSRQLNCWRRYTCSAYSVPRDVDAPSILADRLALVPSCRNSSGAGDQTKQISYLVRA